MMTSLLFVRYGCGRIHSAAIRLFITFVLLIYTIPVFSQTNGTGSDPELVTAINTILDDKTIASGFQGVIIQSLQTGETLYELNADKTFLPASNNKLLTAAVALEKLGKGFVYRTRVYRTGKINSKGVLHGDLILQGSGDPLLAPNDLKVLARKVKTGGIREIRGIIGYDASLFDTQFLGEGWSWDDEMFYYSAQVSALNINQNLISVQCLPGEKVGAAAKFVIGPADLANGIRYVFVPKVVTSKPGSEKLLTLKRWRDTNIYIFSGSIPLGIKPTDNPPIGITIHYPANFTTGLFFAYLNFPYIRYNEWSYEPYPQRTVSKNAVLVAEHKSASLPIYLKRLNKESNNLVAECLLKTVGAKVKGKGTANADGTGSTVALEWFKSIGLDTSRIRMADGSGLSRVNYVSPRNLIKLLAYMKTRPDFAVFYDSLPIAGVDGTLRNRMKDTAAANNCRAKTGTMMQVCSLSGYVTGKDGEPFAFSILMNNQLAPSSDARTVQDKIVVLLAEHSRSKP